MAQDRGDASEQAVARELMARLRDGDTRCARDIPIAVTAAGAAPLALRLKQLEVRRLPLRPFKVKGVPDAIVLPRQPSPELHKAA